ncbi:MAG: hemolysin family protein [Treponema sp.]|nr:hemolysin family protein [Treponema sp.]
MTYYIVISVVLVILILCVGFFTSSETAYLSLTKLKVRRLVEENKKNSKIVANLKDKMDRLLTTVLIGTNFLNSLVSALATALVIKIFGGGGIGLPTLATAFFITVFGQIIPKTIAGLHPEQIACFTAKILYILQCLFFPLIWFFEKLSHGAVFVVEKIMKPSAQIVTEEELKTLISLGEKEGTIEKNESKMMNKIIKFNDSVVSDIMKHRTFVSSVDSKATYNEVIDEFLRSGFSTITVYKNNKENIIGVINYKSVLYASESIDKGEGFAGRFMSEVLFVPGTFSILELLKKFRLNEYKFAIVLSEQGETSGIVTMEDIIRMVFGRMTDENSYDNIPAEEKIKLISVNTFLVPGDVKLDDVNEILDLHLESENMNTLGGWLLEQIGHLPAAGQTFQKDSVIYTAEDIGQRRIVSVRIKLT